MHPERAALLNVLEVLDQSRRPPPPPPPPPALPETLNLSAGESRRAFLRSLHHSQYVARSKTAPEEMAPARSQYDSSSIAQNSAANNQSFAQNQNLIGPPPSTINVSEQYLFQQQLQQRLIQLGTNPTREDTFRLQGVQWIQDARSALQLPVRTFATACSYYHKFRLSHKDTEYQYQEAAAGALFTACKIEDTLKKSKEILCASHNLRVSASEHLSPDDSSFEGPSRIVTGLERLMLEASGFDFRVRYPHKHLIKLLKHFGIEKDVGKVAYDCSIDMYRTFAPLKQTSASLSFACIELATILLEKQESDIRGESVNYEKFNVTRAQIIETMLDLLDLFTHFQKSSIVGPRYDINTYIQIRIKLNKETEREGLSRYTEHHELPKTNGFKSNIMTPKTPITPASPSDVRINGRDMQSPATLSPHSNGSGRRGVAGADGTVRFMLDADQAKAEEKAVNEFYKVEYEEYEVEEEEPVRQERDDRNPRNHPRSNGRDDRFFHNNHHTKRVRR